LKDIKTSESVQHKFTKQLPKMKTIFLITSAELSLD